MKLKVTFREYCKSEKDPETGKSERGEFIGSFTEIIEGATPLEITERASERAQVLSKEHDADVRVWEIPVTVTPRGIVSE